MSHEFRRVRLRDPALPDELLPKNWVGGRAWTLARDLYEALLDASDAYLRAIAESDTGRMPAPPIAYYDRFGGVGPRSTLRATGAE
jgi:phenylacetic acid degradation operon negative regulatory protein